VSQRRSAWTRRWVLLTRALTRGHRLRTTANLTLTFKLMGRFALQLL
jgi:hypothetical protein